MSAQNITTVNVLRVMEPRGRDEATLIAEYENRLLAVYNAATKDDLAAGLRWYDEAQEFCRDIAAGTKYTTAQVAACLAVLSAQTAWQANKNNLRAVVQWHASATPPTQAMPGYFISGRQIRKCMRILYGDYGTTVDDLRGHISGKGYFKTARFFLNLNGEYGYACCDTWMARACKGTTRGSGTCAPHHREYQVMEQATICAAHRAGVPAAIFQAVVWTAVRGSAE